MAARKRSGKRELLTTRGGKRFVRRGESGRFSDSQDSVSRSLRSDVKKRAKKSTAAGQGDKGDRKRASRAGR